MPQPAEPDAPPTGDRSLLAECLLRYADEGVTGLSEVLAAHPAQARWLLHRVLLLAELGLLPDAPEAPAH